MIEGGGGGISHDITAYVTVSHRPYTLDIEKLITLLGSLFKTGKFNPVFFYVRQKTNNTQEVILLLLVEILTT